ncbi:MAG TPA: MBL fold metallo-hydrolase [Pseudogracilibacillus sp.]|nr:MBL fold metallo-hydrolase [Pseudogracilibacillus sp.]
MKLTVVGYWGGYPHVDGATSMYVIEKDGFMLVVDVGSASLAKFQKYKKVKDIDAVLISHYHTDHIADIGVLQHALLINHYVTGDDKKVPIYGHIENERQFQELNHDFTEAVAYDPNQVLKLGPFTIRFIKTKHSVPCYGMKITDGDTTIVYTADSAYMDDWIDFSRHADLLITDCNFYQKQKASDAGHMTSEEGAYIAKEADVKELLLSHLPQFGDQSLLVKEAQSIFQGPIHLASEGLVWEGIDKLK